MDTPLEVGQIVTHYEHGDGRVVSVGQAGVSFPCGVIHVEPDTLTVLPQTVKVELSVEDAEWMASWTTGAYARVITTELSDHLAAACRAALQERGPQ